VLEIRDRHPQLSLDNAFVAWFLRAFVVDDENAAVKALLGGSKDKGIDALHLDHELQIISIIQGKYHETNEAVSEQRSDVIALADLGRALLLEDQKLFGSLISKANSVVRESLKKARQALHKKDYRLTLYFVTTGKVSKTHKEEALQRIEDWEKASFEVFARRDLLRGMQDYIEGLSPPVPTVSLRIHGEELFNRYDGITGISRYVFTMLGRDLCDLYHEIGDRLFARNIRGYQGDTKVNEDIKFTLENEPKYFWYFNNGVTIICDEARQITERANRYLRVTNAQVINGQQTVRILASQSDSPATLIAKVIVVPRESEIGHTQYSHLVNQIVKATNWQNKISQSDLKSNDPIQVKLERDLKKLGYHYLRKKQSKSEARRITGDRYDYLIKKENMAKYVGACMLDPSEVRKGKNWLFEDDVYPRIFSQRHVADYLTFYWLARITSKFSRGDIRRGYAKWLVLHFLWRKIRKQFRKSYFRENFRYMAERQNAYDKEFKPFYSAIKSIFAITMLFYRRNKKTKDGILDESSFFRIKNRHTQFMKFWVKDKSPRRQRVDRQLNRFIEHVDSIER
jgi:hypothetical protein